MPPPPSYLDIVALPFSTAITVAEFNGGTYGGVANECWFRRVASSKEVLSGFTTRDTGVFAAKTEIYESDGTTLIHTIDRSSNNQFAWYFIFEAGTYYIKITNGFGGGISNDFTASFDTLAILANTDILVGDVIINDDTAGFPAVILRDSTLLGVFEALPAGETGAILPTGESIWWDIDTDTLFIFDATWTFVIAVNTPMGLSGDGPLLAADDTKFYVYDSSDRIIYSITTAGVVTAESGTLSVSVKYALGISRDGTIAYYSNGKFDGIIYQYDLVADSLLPNLYAVAGWQAGQDGLAISPNAFPGEILVLSDGTIVTWWRDASATTTHILHIAADGTLINDFSYLEATYGKIDHISYARDGSDDYIVAWFQTESLSVGTWYDITLADGTATAFKTNDLFSGGINLKGNDDVKAGPSECCIMLTVLGSSSALIVNKVTEPSGVSQTFNFTAGGGLSPSAFTLSDGEQEVFSDIDPGTYSIVEDAVPDYATSYVVSNGSPHTAITVAEGETVIVTVTNTLTANTGSGIYKIVPGKRNDTLWLSGFAGTEDVKIP